MAEHGIRYSVTITTRDIPALLDMLRYEAATVRAWTYDKPQSAPAGAEGYTVNLTSDHYEPDRWASFGIYPRMIASY